MRLNVKMFPEPSWLPVIPLGKAAQIFSYFTFSSPLTLAVLLPFYTIQDPDFYSEFFEVHNV